MLRTKTKRNKTSLNVCNIYEGETIEQKVTRILTSKEGIKDGAPLTYTNRKDGVKPEHDIRTDRWELATEAMDKVTKNKLANREKRMNPEQPNETTKESPTGNEPSGLPTQGTE